MSEIINAVDLTSKLIRCESITPNSAGAIELLISYLEPLGFKCKKINFGEGIEKVENLYARFGTKGPNICFAGHVDVVPTGDIKKWSMDPFGGEIKQGKIWGRGAADMKSGIAAFLSSVSNFLSKEKDFEKIGSISFLITSDEEGKAINGTKKVVEWLEEKEEKITACIVGEPTNVSEMGDTIKVGRRGSFTGFLKVKGVQGHVGYPHLADNPINSLIKMLEPFVKIYLDEGTENFQPSSVMITSVDVNNNASNVIPGEVSATFNIRFNNLHTINSLKAMLKNQFNKITQNYEFNYYCNAEPFLTNDEFLKSTIEKAIKSVVKINPKQSTSGGTSDARFISKICPVVEFGLVGKTMHKIDENVDVDDITKLVSIYSFFLSNYFGVSSFD
ncbi:succinyl-diaminopimelate desuccinylase [Alphaproteobacteria bacterium]|jgi:succinyl-diaminopimelate desuccinylase|nr:succinyl-diaminopimelate desuccinylase [Alphaproteobacteria bacterium]MDB3916343.1 succinyl-diaminopimelate desuccinylase [Alphaproteobacteria bacterium]MDC1035185.1 succinyl-diaminopimelate desuccinylase [Alphaproteobacteria bacterium]MDC6452486.1 succinyl-diaminopimelate desuccinylase [Alphaproteobacteria bacterium]